MTAVILTIVCALLLVPALVFFVEVLAAVMPGDASSAPSAEPLRLAVLIPAHDEETTIARTLRSVGAQLRASDRLLVVADNCSDQTAQIAQDEGAEVIRRESQDLRGKGYALDHGVRHLEKDPPDVVIIIDADCVVSSGSLATLAAAAQAAGAPAQAIDLMRAPEGAGLRVRIAEFAWLIKNRVRPQGLRRMGLPCQLMGTGMAFPWACIRASSLATGHLVEDLKLGIELARRGLPPRFCLAATVSSEFPTSDEGIRSQRTRWEHGHLRAILSEAPKLLLGALIRRDAALAAIALDLSVPPLALLAMAIAASWAISLGVELTVRASLPFFLATAAAVLFGCAVTLSWRVFGRQTVSGKDLVMAALYAIWKVPLYLGFLLKPQSKWVRSKR
ncbi:MAG TPA: glycosyltransferase [Steroidobacteraceae bacterium]|jgi:cellulose synthase/poly-beta-1,6-N-acetylglucosamine synthase-like glycosyltransferase